MSPTPVTGCIFCAIAAGGVRCHRVAESEGALAFLDIHPAQEGHTLVVPKEHAESIYEMTPAAMAAVAELVRRVAPAIRAVVQPDGLMVTQANGVAAGQTVMHYHTHLIPRVAGVRLRMHGTEAGDPARLAGLADEIGKRVRV